MNKSFFFVPKILVSVLISVLFLVGCGESIESPEKVMDKSKDALTEVESGRLAIEVEAEGENGEEGLVFEGGLEMVFDHRDEDNKDTELTFRLAGDITAAEQTLNGEADVDMVIADSDYYVRLNELVTSDESLDTAKPFIEMYKGKWLRIADDFIPQDIRELQGEDEAMKAKREQLEKLFKETTLFDVVKEYGIEKLNGESVYHYGIKPNIEGFKTYMAKSAVIDGRELTATEVEEAVAVLSYVKNAELYIDTDDYYILKAVFVFTGGALGDGADANMEVKISVEGSDYNKSVSVEPPADAEDFNPISLMMGFGGVPAVPADGSMDTEVPVGGLQVEPEGLTEEIIESDDAVLDVIEAE